MVWWHLSKLQMWCKFYCKSLHKKSVKKGGFFFSLMGLYIQILTPYSVYSDNICIPHRLLITYKCIPFLIYSLWCYIFELQDVNSWTEISLNCSNAHTVDLFVHQSQLSGLLSADHRFESHLVCSNQFRPLSIQSSSTQVEQSKMNIYLWSVTVGSRPSTIKTHRVITWENNTGHTGRNSLLPETLSSHKNFHMIFRQGDCAEKVMFF